MLGRLRITTALAFRVFASVKDNLQQLVAEHLPSDIQVRAIVPIQVSSSNTTFL